MTSCKSCQFCGFNRQGQEVGMDVCGIDGKQLINQAWKPCDAYIREQGADEHENTIEAEIIDLCAGADMDGMEIEIL